MPFQTLPSIEVLNGKDFWRLRQELESVGDIFEIDVSCVALYVGPDSDAGNLRVVYFDPQQTPNELQEATISPGAPFLGRIDALLSQQIASTGQKARILVSPADLIDNNYVRPGVTQPAVTVRVPAFIDIVGVFGNLISVPQMRSDRRWQSPLLSVGAGGAGFVNSTDIQFPIYGRKCWTVSVTRPSATQVLDVSIEGVRLTPGAVNPSVQLGTMSFPAISVDLTQSLSFRACETGLIPSSDVQRPGGFFDILLVNLQLTGAGAGFNASVSITATDRD